ncbi:MAG: LytTR family DNA-binding domain-containing protein [Flavobacteriaceae bacterium]|jgi:DNA-binding LytR/AlgR family response regulator|nr:LytTR family DNA-binding domain-containing protein [Flavobacteriaceae bacterium]
MNALRIVIVEDEKPAARALERKIEKLGYSIIEKLTSVEEAVIWFNTNTHPDLIFLDIQLSDGLSFDIFDQVTVKSAIIFTTAYDAYALRAFKLNSIDYLLKPIQEDELQQAMLKFQEQHSAFFAFSEQLTMFKQFMNTSAKEYKERFTVRVGTQIKIIMTSNIVCFFSENKGTYLKTTDDRDYLVDHTLEEIERMLDPKAYFRSSRKHIVQLKDIKDIAAFSNSRLKVNMKSTTLDDIIVSRERVNDFKEWIEC